MVVDKTLYDVLGVDPNATQQTISQAVKRKSLEHHPDRGGSLEMMQKVNAAKEILTDSEKRKIYDQYGLEGIKSTMTNENFQFPGFPGGSIFDLFDLFNRRSNHQENNRRSQRNDIKHVLNVSLEDLYLGTTKTVNIDYDVVCNDCNGTGCNDGIERQCTECEGTGIETLIYRMGSTIERAQCQCSLCDGQGNMTDINNRCQNCYGKKIFRKNKRLDVNIPHGSQDGETIKFIGEANQIANGESGTVYVILKQEPHPIFNRNKDDLILKMEINLTESLCGFQRPIKLLDNHEILINHPPGIPIRPNSYRCIKGYGMPNRHTHSHGDFIIHFDVKFPENNFITNDNQRKQLEAILPPKSHVKLNSRERYEEAQMMEYDMNQQNFQNGFHHHQTEDDDDQHQGIQCQTQ